MRLEKVASAVRTTSFLGIALFAFSAGFPPLDDAAEVNLTLHMLQHVLIMVAGVLIAYPIFRKNLAMRDKSGIGPGLALLAAGSLIVFWHFPAPWDAAVLNPGTHIFEHLSFLFVGLLAGSWLLLLPDSGKIGALLAAFFGHMGYAVLLISPWNQQVYPLYSIADQAALGWVLLLTGPSLLVGIGYVVARNPSWLAGLGGSGAQAARRETVLDRARTPSWLVPALTVILLTVLVTYFAVATAAVATSASNPGQASGTAVVYIDETPISWQYSPQAATVVLGVNNTVTWISHSIAYDTVTGRTGDFGSGPIAPGQTFTYTFTKPGVYSYYCIYHPWMAGTITVVAGSQDLGRSA